MNLLLTLLIVSLADPNSLSEDFGWKLLIQHWGQWNTVTCNYKSGPMTSFYMEHVPKGKFRAVVRAIISDPNSRFYISWDTEKIVNYDEFARFARIYRPLHPVIPIKPNLPPEPNLADILANLPFDSDPNLVEAIKGLTSTP